MSGGKFLLPWHAVRKSDFHYELPFAQIAQQPATPRSAARLLCLDGGGAIVDRQFVDLPALLRPGDLLVFNDTRVVPARLYGTKQTGGQVEVLIERVLDQKRVVAQVRAAKPPKLGQRLYFDGALSAQVTARHSEFYELAFETDDVSAVLERIGHVPLPPYIKRTDAPLDRERYQTVYARIPGAVAAPTAGLHFDEALLQRLGALGVEQAFVTLHVGAGTFQPLRREDVAQQRLHPERVHIGNSACEQVNRARSDGRRVIAVGTTVVRALESAARDRRLEPFEGETEIFVYPGYRFQIIDALITNFHLPESSLLMLVCAFAGTETVLRAYRHAVQQGYRFYSYGDAMWVSA